MKKIILLIVIFTILAFGVTAGLINHKKSASSISSKNSGDTNQTDDNSVDLQEESPKEQTIDLYSTYDENDLVLSQKSITVDGYDGEVNIPIVEGLKDKNIEKKLNKNIEDKAINLINKYLKQDGVTELKFYGGDFFQANFANVISFRCSVSGKKDGEKFSYTSGFNFELVNGNEIKLEDFFVSNESMTTIVRMALYKMLARLENKGEEMYSYNNLHYDSQKGAWLVEYSYYGENSRSEIIEYVPELTDYEIEKEIKKYFKNGEEFYFTPQSINIIFNDKNDEYDHRYDYAYLWLKDIADKVVIYNKYLTKESIFEKDDIGYKNIVTCSAEYQRDKYRTTRFEGNNFFYDVKLANRIQDDYPAMKYVNEKISEEMKEAYKIVDEYRNISKNNTDKMYCLWVEPELECGIDNYRIYDSNLGYDTFKNKANNLFIVNRKMKIIVRDISEKKQVLDSVLAKYRYHNISFYNGVYDTIRENDELANVKITVPVTEKVETIVYDVLSGKEIKDAKEIFKEGVDIENIVKLLNPYPRQLGNIIKYEINFYGVGVYDDSENGYPFSVGYAELISYTNLKEISPEIFPSNVRYIQESELDGMNKDELYRAYNEIFARYGHDFKTPEYKYYFNLWDWYKPISGKTVSLEELNEIERYNVQLIKSKIDSM